MNIFLRLLSAESIENIGEDLLDILVEEGIMRDGILQEDTRLRIALLALKHGSSISDVAKVLSWKDFERFASMILREYRYEVYNSVRIKRAEIDILAIENDQALVIDCKHWKYNNSSRLRIAIHKQIDRIRLLLESKMFGISSAIPVILTLYEYIKFIDDVPVVPIDKFSSFINEYKGYDMLVIKD